MSSPIADRIDELVDDITGMARTKLNALKEHWTEMYDLDDSLMTKFCKSFRRYTHDLFEDIEGTVVEKKTTLLNECENQLKEHRKLEEELQLEIQMELPLNGPLTVRLEKVDENLQKFRILRAKRIEQLEILRQKERALCEFLTEPIFPIANEVPSEAQLAQLEARCRDLLQIKMDRQDTFSRIKVQILNMMKALEEDYASEFEKMVVESEPDSFSLDASNMKKLDGLLAKFEQRVRDTEEQMACLKEKLGKLWDRIGEGEDVKKSFLQAHTGIGKTVRDDLLNEIQRCEEIKRANIKPVIEKIRLEIVSLWERLTYTSNETCEFGAFFTDSFDEDVLTLHELELARLEELYQGCADILELAEKRKHLWERMDHLQEQATDPKRLKNRGGQLLREEKERKALEKSLPLIESQLKKSLVSYYEKHGKPFLWHGCDLLQKITSENRDDTLATYRLGVSRLLTPRGTPSRRNSRLTNYASSNNVAGGMSDDSVASYSQFQMELGGSCIPTPSKRFTPQPSAAKRFCTPVTRNVTRSSSRLPLRQIQNSPYRPIPNSPYRAHSSPTTPKRLSAFKPKPSPRRTTPRRYGFSSAKKSFHF